MRCLRGLASKDGNGIRFLENPIEGAIWTCRMAKCLISGPQSWGQHMIIYNISGLLLGLSGVIVAVTLYMLTGIPSLGLFALAALWIAFGRPRPALTDGRRDPAPALFFIPLAFLAVPIVVAGIASAVQQIRGPAHEAVAALVSPEKVQAPHTARELLRADERVLAAEQFSGNVELSKKVFTALKAVVNPRLKPYDAHVFTRIAGDKLVVLIRLESLRHAETDGRGELLDLLAQTIATVPEAATKNLYLGLRGMLLYGGILTPAGRAEGKAVPAEALLAAYGEAESQLAGATVAK